jgi:hypothetical protein
MLKAARRLVVLSCAFLTLLVVGAPDFAALERSMSKVFVTNVTERTGIGAMSGTAGPADATEASSSLTTPTPLFTTDSAAPFTVGTAEPDEAVAAPRPPGRGVLVPLYVSFVALQGLDLHSTFYAIHRGATEANPMMAGLVDHPAAFVALKVGTATGIIYMTDRLRRHSRVGAIVIMAAINSAYAIVVARNYRLANRLAR